jgi:hypothetical protein
MLPAELWIYDLRNNQSFTLKTRKLMRSDLGQVVPGRRFG